MTFGTSDKTGVELSMPEDNLIGKSNLTEELNRYVDMRLKALEAAIIFRGETDDAGRRCLPCTLFLSYGIAKGKIMWMKGIEPDESNKEDWPAFLWFVQKNLIHDQHKNRQLAPRLTDGSGQVYMKDATIWPYAAADKPYRVPHLVVFVPSIEGLTFDEIPELKEANS